MGEVIYMRPPHKGLLRAIIGPIRTVRSYIGSVSAGFASPALDYAEKPLDFNELLGVGRPSVFSTLVEGDSMVGAGIYDGDLLVVDFAVTPRDGSIVVAIVNGGLTVKRLRISGDEYMLVPENPIYPTLYFKKSEELKVWGVVMYNLRKHGA